MSGAPTGFRYGRGGASCCPRTTPIGTTSTSTATSARRRAMARAKANARITSYSKTPGRRARAEVDTQWGVDPTPYASLHDLYDERYLPTLNCEQCDVVLTTGSKITGTTRCMDHDHDTKLLGNIVCHGCNNRRGVVDNPRPKMPPLSSKTGSSTRRESDGQPRGTSKSRRTTRRKNGKTPSG